MRLDSVWLIRAQQHIFAVVSSFTVTANDTPCPQKKLLQTQCLRVNPEVLGPSSASTLQTQSVSLDPGTQMSPIRSVQGLTLKGLSYRAQVPVEFLDRQPLQRDSAIADVVGHLVACNGEMYLFGSVEKSELGKERPSNELLKFVPRFDSEGRVESIYCVRIPSGERHDCVCLPPNCTSTPCTVL